MIDPTGKLILELRAAAAAWPDPHTDVEVRGGDLAGMDIPEGDKPRAIVVRRTPWRRWGRQGLGTFTYVLLCYDPDPRLATVLAGLASSAVHDRGPRITGAPGARIAIFRSETPSGDGTLTEPGTGYPLERVLVEVIAAATVVA